MNLQDYAAMRELECENKKGWGAAAALWVIAAVIVVAFFVYSWHQNCNERTQFAVGLANLTGRINCMEPDVRWAGQQLYKANGTIQSINRTQLRSTKKTLREQESSHAADIAILKSRIKPESTLYLI